MSDQLDDLLKIDRGQVERDYAVAKAGAGISVAIARQIEQHGLTYVEVIRILAQKLDYWAAYAQRAERRERGES